MVCEMAMTTMSVWNGKLGGFRCGRAGGEEAGWRKKKRTKNHKKKEKKASVQYLTRTGERKQKREKGEKEKVRKAEGGNSVDGQRDDRKW